MKARMPLAIVLLAASATPASGELIKEHLIHLRGVAEPGYLYITESELSRDGTTLAIGFGAQDVISVDFAAYQNSGCMLNEAASLINQASLATAENYEAASTFYDGLSLQYRLRVEAADYGDVKVDWTGTDLWHWESWNWFNVDGYIPEPGTAGLLTLGLVMLVRRRRRGCACAGQVLTGDRFSCFGIWAWREAAFRTHPPVPAGPTRPEVPGPGGRWSRSHL